MPPNLRVIELVKENYRDLLKKSGANNRANGGVLIIDDTPLKPFEGTTFRQGRERVVRTATGGIASGPSTIAPDIKYQRNS